MRAIEEQKILNGVHTRNHSQRGGRGGSCTNKKVEFPISQYGHSRSSSVILTRGNIRQKQWSSENTVLSPLFESLQSADQLQMNKQSIESKLQLQINNLKQNFRPFFAPFVFTCVYIICLSKLQQQCLQF